MATETKSVMTREERMATQPIGRLMAGMTLPAILAQIINILYSIIDRIYIGHMEGVGANALTGVGVTFCITVFISAFPKLRLNSAPLTLGFSRATLTISSYVPSLEPSLIKISSYSMAFSASSADNTLAVLPIFCSSL